MEFSNKNHIATITINAIVTVLLVISMAILFTGIMFQRQDISNLRTNLKTIGKGSGGIQVRNVICRYVQFINRN